MAKGTPPPRKISTSISPLQDPGVVAGLTGVLSNCRKAQVPYETGWDKKPNSCLKLVSDIENDDTNRKNASLNRARSLTEISEKKRVRQAQDAQESAIIAQQILATLNKDKSGRQTLGDGISYGNDNKSCNQQREPINDRHTFSPRSFDQYEDEDQSLSLHFCDSTFNDTANQSMKYLDQLNLSEIKLDSMTEEEHQNNSSKNSQQSGKLAYASTPLRQTKKVSIGPEPSIASTKKPSPQRKSNTFSIRNDAEFDENDNDEIDNFNQHENRSSHVQLPVQSPLYYEYQRRLQDVEREYRDQWLDTTTKQLKETYQKITKVRDDLGVDLVSSTSLNQDLMSLLVNMNKRREELSQQLEEQLKKQKEKQEREVKEKEIELTTRRKLEEEKKQLDAEKEKAEAEAASKLQEIENSKRKKEDEAKARKAQEDAAAKAEDARLQEQLQAQAQELQQKQQQAQREPDTKGENSKTLPTLPPEFRNAVLQSDLFIYIKALKQLEDVKTTIQDISSSNPITKNFYFSAMKVVNTPINSISNLSEHHVQQKIQHFTQLFEGKAVYIGDSMKTGFLASGQINGDLFVMNLFAFRFVKKSEAEITRGMSALTPLATVGVQLIRRFPTLGPLIKANFYKVCPFLVPFSYPRKENMTNEQYAGALGHEELGGTERAIQQVLLERLGGYCTLYGIMVNIFEKHNFSDLSADNAGFFSLKEVWRILATTMRLEPQVDVTCTVLQALLETSSDSLFRIYKSQFRKLMNELSSRYLMKIRNITPSGQTAALVRLELFLESQIPKLQ